MSAIDRLKEQILLQLIERGTQSKQELAEATGYAVNSLSPVLAAMGKEGKIRQSKGYYRVIRTDRSIKTNEYLKEMIHNPVCQLVYANKSHFEPQFRDVLLPLLLCFTLTDDPDSLESEFWVTPDEADLSKEQTRQAGLLVGFLNELLDPHD